MFYPLFVRPASAGDIAQLEKIFVEADIFLDEREIHEWPEDYPVQGELASLSETGYLFTVTDHGDRPLGCVTLVPEDGALAMKNAVLDRVHRGQGCFSVMLRYAERHALSQGLTSITAEPGADNYIMRQALVREKFISTGERTTPDGRRVVRYEKPLIENQ